MSSGNFGIVGNKAAGGVTVEPKFRALPGFLRVLTCISNCLKCLVNPFLKKSVVVVVNKGNYSNNHGLRSCFRGRSRYLELPDPVPLAVTLTNNWVDNSGFSAWPWLAKRPHSPLKVEKHKSLAETLGVEPLQTSAPPPSVTEIDPDVSSRDFCRQIIASAEFRRYILHGLTLGDIPAAVVCRILNEAWGKPVERVEHSGPDGDPIVTEVRRVIVRVAERQRDEFEDSNIPAVTH